MPVVSPKEAKVAATPKESAADDSDADEAPGGPQWPRNGQSWWQSFVFLRSQSHSVADVTFILSSEVP